MKAVSKPKTKNQNKTKEEGATASLISMFCSNIRHNSIQRVKPRHKLKTMGTKEWNIINKIDLIFIKGDNRVNQIIQLMLLLF